ncbi:recombination regulator RecX [Kaarinaea lacus]
MTEIAATDVRSVRIKAMNLLARREHSVAELKRKLQNKGYDENVIEQVLQDLCQQNLLSDARFTESYVNYRCNNGFGPLRIQQELKQKGISDAVIDAYINDSERWQQKAAEVWAKRFGGSVPNDIKTKAKQSRFLQYRGFTFEQIRHLFDAD